MTMLFSDVRGFTAIAERLQNQPQVLTRLMNRLMTSLTAEIMANNGTIDKYMGDGVMAFWNAPLSDADHALHACAAALSMATPLDRLNADALHDARNGMTGAGRSRNAVGHNHGLHVIGHIGLEQTLNH